MGKGKEQKEGHKYQGEEQIVREWNRKKILKRKRSEGRQEVSLDYNEVRNYVYGVP